MRRPYDLKITRRRTSPWKLLRRLPDGALDTAYYDSSLYTNQPLVLVITYARSRCDNNTAQNVRVSLHDISRKFVCIFPRYCGHDETTSFFHSESIFFVYRKFLLLEIWSLPYFLSRFSIHSETFPLHCYNHTVSPSPYGRGECGKGELKRFERLA